jgi:cysteine synthase
MQSCGLRAGSRLTLIMPANMSEERRAAMAAYGAQLISVPAGKMELARDLAAALEVLTVPFGEGLEGFPRGHRGKSVHAALGGSSLRAELQEVLVQELHNTRYHHISNPYACNMHAGEHALEQAQGSAGHCKAKALNDSWPALAKQP